MTGLDRAQITGLDRDARRTEILRAKEFNGLPRGVVAYAEITSDDTATSGSTEKDVTGLSDTFTAVPGRRYKITGSYEVTRSAASGDYAVRIRSGSTQIAIQENEGSKTSGPISGFISYVSNSSLSGSQTWRLTIQLVGGTGTVTVNAGATYPAYLMVEDIGLL